MAIPDPALAATSPTGSWLISEFRRVGALSPETARPMEVGDVRTQYALNQLLDTGILKEDRRDMYYLDEATLALTATRARLWRIGIIGVGVLVLFGAFVRIIMMWL